MEMKQLTSNWRRVFVDLSPRSSSSSRCKRRLNLWSTSSDSLILLRALISPFSPSDLLQSNKSLSSSLIPMFDLYGVGLRQALDMSTQDESLIIANDATLNDMEGSAVAYVAELLKVPVMFLKAVTDLIDGDKPTAQEFLQNLSLVTSALEETATKVTNFINGKNPFRPLTIIST
ncbi:unnamed protein product [Brassica oleracea]